MISEEELQKMKNINMRVVEKALSEAEESLKDSLNTKNSINQKSYSLLNIYITLFIAIISSAALVLQKYPLLFLFLMGLSVFLIPAIITILFAILGSNYGKLGSNPSFWLVKGFIDAPDEHVPTIFSYLVHSHQGVIELSERSNEKRIRYQNISICITVAGLIVSFLGFLIGALYEYPFCVPF